MSNVITNAYRKEKDGSIKEYYFPSTGSVISLTGFTSYSGTSIPAIDANTSALDAIRYIDANIKKLSNEKVNTSSLAAVATSGKYSDLTGKPSIPTNVSELNNDKGYISSVSWNDILNKPSSYTPSSHTQSASTITSMAGYTIQDADEIVVNDTLNQAIGKLEGSLNNKVSKGETVVAATKATQDGSGNVITSTYVKAVTSSGNTVTITKGNDATTSFTISDTDEKVKSEPNGTVKAYLLGTSSSATSTGTTVFDPNIYTTSTAGELVANKFTGTLNGAATSAAQADKLSSAKTITLSGAVTGSTSFDGSANKTITTTLSDIDASKITSGTIDIARIPKAAIPELKIVADDTARFALTTSDVQNGDTVQVESTGKMYYVKDQTQLATEAGYAVYTAGAASSVDWSGITNKPTSFKPASHTQAASTITGLAVVATSGNYSDLNGKPTIPSKVSQLTNDTGYITGVTWDDVTGKPSSFTPASHTQAASTITGLATVATSGSYADLTNKPTIPSKVSQLTNDSGYITGVSWSQVTDKPTSFTPDSHNQASNTITALTGYAKPSATGAIGASDSLNSALGKLEKGLDGKLSTTGTAAKATADAAGNTITTTYVKGLSVSGKVITYTKGDGSTGTITTQDTTYGAATSSALGLVKVGSNITNTSGTISLTKANVTNALGYTPPTTDTKYSVMTGATSDADGASGLVPAPAAGSQTKYLRADGTWQTPPDTNTTYGAATSSILGLVKVGSNITNSSGTISLTKANVTNALGYTPPTTDTTYNVMTGATSSAAGAQGLVPAPAAGKQTSFLRGDGTWVVPPDTNTTYSAGAGISLSGTTFSNSGVRSVKAGSSANQLSVDIGGTTTTITVNNVANATAADKLKTGRTIALSGAVTGSVTFDGSADKTISTTLSNFDASKITSGTIDIARLPKAAIPELKIVADDTARFALTTSDIQNGDTVQVTSTGKMYYVKDQTKLSSEDGYAVYTAGAASSVPWSGVTGKPSSYTPAAHTQAASTITGLATVATSGSYADLSNKPTIPSKVSQLTNDSGYITGVSWDNVSSKPTSFTPASHNQASNTITALTGYSKPSSTSAIGTSDSLNAALGKLEKALDSKLSTSGTAAKATQDSAGQQINTTYIKGLSVSGKTITYTKGDGTTGTITTQDTNTTYSAFKGATADAAGGTGLVPAPAKGAQTKYLRADGTWQTPPDTNTTYSASNGISLSGTTFSNSGVRSIATGSSNGTISVNTNGTTANVAVKGLGSAAYSNTSSFAAASHTHPQDNNFLAHGNEFNFVPTLTANMDVHFNYRQTGGNNTSGYKITNYHFSNGAGSTDGVTVIAGTFSGALSGNASSATKATKDSADQQITTTYIKGLSVSGRTITYTKGDGSTGTITTQDTNTTYSAFKGATSSAAGGAGLVPAPAAGAQAKYLRADGTWQTPPDTNTTYSVFKGATSSAAGGTGLVPAPAKGAQTKYLRADGTWQTPPDTNTTYSAATSSNLGLVKIGSNISVSSGTISLTKANITNALGYTPPTADTNTHYTTHAKVGASATATANAAASNGSVYLNILDDSTVRDSHLIKGAGATTVTSDANGVITISSTDTNTNTTYSAGTGISLSGTTFSNAGVRSIATGGSNGTISVNTNGTTTNVAVKGLGSAAYSNTSAFAAASHSHSNYALKTDIPSVWDSSGHLVSPAGWKLWVEN
ncbi:MAG: hypothetical protein SPF22_08555 [Candidatus Onthovivens sp.]|nr:hypothetical protein [Candidatus Onthovivens sp.]